MDPFRVGLGSPRFRQKTPLMEPWTPVVGPWTPLVEPWTPFELDWGDLDLDERRPRSHGPIWWGRGPLWVERKKRREYDANLCVCVCVAEAEARATLNAGPVTEARLSQLFDPIVRLADDRGPYAGATARSFSGEYANLTAYPAIVEPSCSSDEGNNRSVSPLFLFLFFKSLPSAPYFIAELDSSMRSIDRSSIQIIKAKKLSWFTSYDFTRTNTVHTRTCRVVKTIDGRVRSKRNRSSMKLFFFFPPRSRSGTERLWNDVGQAPPDWWHTHPHSDTS